MTALSPFLYAELGEVELLSRKLELYGIIAMLFDILEKDEQAVKFFKKTDEIAKQLGNLKCAMRHFGFLILPAC